MLIAYFIFYLSAAISPPVITSLPVGGVVLSLGQTISLDCTASGNPSPSISWTRNGHVIDSDSLSNVEQVSNGSLILSDVTGLEEGKYSCKATNEEGEYSITFLLQILTNPPGQSYRPASASERRPSVTAMLGSEVTLDCVETLASNTSEVLWRRGNVGVCGERVRLGSKGSLILSNVRTEDGGVYSCLVFHPKGLYQSDVHLTVLPREGENTCS